MKNKLPNNLQRTAWISFILLQIIFIGIVIGTREMIIIDTSEIKKYSDEYLPWYMYEYLSTVDVPATLIQLVRVVKVGLSLLLLVVLGIVSELAHRTKVLSARELAVCIGANLLAFVLIRLGLSVLFEHYYLYWELLLPEMLSIAVFSVSQTAGKNVKKNG